MLIKKIHAKNGSVFTSCDYINDVSSPCKETFLYLRGLQEHPIEEIGKIIAAQKKMYPSKNWGEIERVFKAVSGGKENAEIKPVEQPVKQIDEEHTKEAFEGTENGSELDLQPPKPKPKKKNRPKPKPKPKN